MMVLHEGIEASLPGAASHRNDGDLSLKGDEFLGDELVTPELHESLCSLVNGIDPPLAFPIVPLQGGF